LEIVEIRPQYGIRYLSDKPIAKVHTFKYQDIQDGLMVSVSKLDAIKFLQEYEQSGIFLHGKNGIGKTTLLCVYANMMFDKYGTKTLFVY